MTSRERWTIYPLLFLSLGLGTRLAIVPTGRFAAVKVDELEAKRVVCQELIIEDDRKTVVIHLGRLEKDGGGRIEIADASGETRAAIGTQREQPGGVIEISNSRGETIVTVSADELGDYGRILVRDVGGTHRRVTLDHRVPKEPAPSFPVELQGEKP